MSIKEKRKSRKKRKTSGIGAIVEPGVGASYIRGAWMKKLDNLGKQQKRKQLRKSRVKRK